MNKTQRPPNIQQAKIDFLSIYYCIFIVLLQDRGGETKVSFYGVISKKRKLRTEEDFCFSEADKTIVLKKIITFTKSKISDF